MTSEALKTRSVGIKHWGLPGLANGRRVAVGVRIEAPKGWGREGSAPQSRKNRF